MRWKCSAGTFLVPDVTEAGRATTSRNGLAGRREGPEQARCIRPTWELIETGHDSRLKGGGMSIPWAMGHGHRRRVVRWRIRWSRACAGRGYGYGTVLGRALRPVSSGTTEAALVLAKVIQLYVIVQDSRMEHVRREAGVCIGHAAVPKSAAGGVVL